MNLLSGAEIQCPLCCPYQTEDFFVVVSFKYMIILSGHWKLSVIERSPLTLDRCPYFREIRL